MKRFGCTCGLALLGLIIGTGCDGTRNSWGAHPQSADGPSVADKTVAMEGPAPQEPAPAVTEPAVPPETAADGSTAAVADFVRRLQTKKEDLPAANAGPAGSDTAVATAPTDAASAGAASTTANMAMEIPAPGSAADPFKKSPQATQTPRIESVSIVATAPEPAEPTAEAKTLSTNEPLDAAAVVQEFSIRKYISMLEEALKTNPADVELQWLLSTMRLVMGDNDKATELSKDIARESAELLSDSVRLFADVRRLLVDPSHPADETLAAVENMRAKLQQRAELIIPVVALCSRVRTFGVYDLMPTDQFLAHQANRTVVYTEVKNFVSKRLDDGTYQTRLAGRLELLSKDGSLVWQHEENAIEEVSRQRREDFFLAQLVALPADLAAGDYVLKVILQDLLGGKANEAQVEFKVAERQLSSTAH